MANLFGKNKLKGIAEQIDTKRVLPFIEIIKTWHNDYHNGSLRHDKETSREQEYNQQFFKTILGYKEKPASPFSFEPKATTDKGQLPDAVISYTDTSKDIRNIAAVIELKGAMIDLDRPQQREGNFSPVQQAFKYKTQYRSVPFVIVSNFWEFRLYHDNLLDYEAWTLDDLIDPTDDYILFKTWFALLQSDSMTTNKGSSKTESLLSDIRVEQEEISKKFYKVYRDARLALLRDMYKNNDRIRSNIDLGIEKAQKIVDRIVFAAFAEDRGLLPDNTLMRVVSASDNSAFGGSLWNTLKGFFDAIDVGSDKLEIPDGYNGGLFKRDDKLNNLHISDEPLRKVMELGAYNFADDLSVNILGHIFEQSISDLEEIKNKVNESQSLETIAQSRRKKDGIFYTPDYIVRYIVDNSLGSYLRKNEDKFKNEFGLRGDIQDKTYEKREKQAYSKYQDFLQNIKVVDPACGSGAFLVHVFDYLLAENKRVGDILGNTLFSSDTYVRDILRNNIYGVDLNEESVEITKLSLWLKTAQKGKKLTSLDANIKCGNSLIDSEDFAPGKSFNWHEQFAEAFKNGGFDVVVGNPPYVRQELIHHQTPFLSRNYKTYSGKADLFVYFYELATNLLKEGGIFGYISSGKFIEANYGKPLLSYLAENTAFSTVVNFHDLEVFDGVTAYPLIFIAAKDKQSANFIYADIDSLDFTSLDSVVAQDGGVQLMKDFVANNYKFHSSATSGILAQLQADSVRFTDVFPAPTVGIKTGFNEGYQSDVGSPYIFGRDIKRYQPVVSKNKLIFPYVWTDTGYVLQAEDDVIGIEYLRDFKEKLSSRAIIKEGILNGSKKWYEYQQINKQLNFDNEYIIYPNVSLGTNFTLSKSNVIDMTGFIIPSNSKYLLALLNSQLFKFFMKNVAISRRGGYNEFKSQYITQFPVKNVDGIYEESFENKVSLIIELTSSQVSVINRFKQLLEGHYSTKLPSRLFAGKWWNREFTDFADSMKANLSLLQREELIELYQKYSSELNLLDNHIKEVNEDINKLIYNLYGLTPQEIQTVETSE